MSNQPIPAVQPRRCRHLDATKGLEGQCQQSAVITGYCKEHVPNHISCQQMLRITTTRVVRVARELSDDFMKRDVVERRLLDDLRAALTTLEQVQNRLAWMKEPPQ